MKNGDDLKQILELQSAMNSKLDAIGKDLEEVKQVQKEHTKALSEHTRILTEHTTILTEHTNTLDEHTDLLERRILPSVVETETTIKSYADAYKTNQANIERLDERVTRFEDEEGYIVPSNLVIHR